MEQELDRVFSIWNRLSRASHEGYVKCYTCGEPFPWQEVDNGHFVDRQHSAVRFDENNCRPQCVNCNRFLGGRRNAFEEALRDELGDEAVDNLIKLGRTEKHYSEEEYKKSITHYKLAVRALGVIL